MKNTNDLLLPCKGASCDFIVDTLIGNSVCISGGGSCMSAELLEAETSNFHDSTLIEATAKIKQILSDIPEDENGRKLSFFVTEMGVLLAWASHGDAVPENGVTIRDGKEAVAAALKLKLA